MLAALTVSLALLAADGPKASDVEMESYRAAGTKAGRNADAHVKLALWCEAHGLTVERAKHLAMAVAVDPSHTIARGLMGLVNDGGNWRRPDDIADRVRDDDQEAKTIGDYEAKREAAAPTADAHWKLTQWCDKNGLKSQAEAHARATVRFDPTRKAAWHRLGYKNHNGRWQTDEQIADELRERDAQQQADRRWIPTVTKWRSDLKVVSKRAGAEAEMRNLSDPRAVPAITRVFATADPRDQAVLVQLLGQIDGVPASRLLAFAAIYGDSAEVRRSAAETLLRRDPRDFVPEVIAQLRDPVKYHVKPVDGPGGMGVLVVDGRDFAVRRRYEVPGLPDATLEFIRQREIGVFSGTDLTRPILARRSPAVVIGSGADDPVLNRLAIRDQIVAQNIAELNRAAAASQAQLERDIASIDRENAQSRTINDRAVGVLTSTTGGDLGPDREGWAKWWTDRQGYAFVSSRQPKFKPVFEQIVPPDYVPVTYVIPSHSSCFAAGTPVHTRFGLKAIETLLVGDLVLTQDVVSGRLSYEPIVVAYHNPPASTVEVRTGDDAIVATGIHRFWLVGKGWQMARDLKPGDTIRTSGGTAQVQAVSARPTQPVFNLEVARGRSFFVGTSGALVHDYSLVETVTQPFDRPPEEVE